MPNPNDRGPSALRNVPIGPSDAADVVARSIGVPPGSAPSSSPPPSPEPAPDRVAVASSPIAPLGTPRTAVLINYYERTEGMDEVVIRKGRDERTGQPWIETEKRPWSDLKMTAEMAFIDDDGTATLIDGSIRQIPFGSGLPGHYDRPGGFGGSAHSRTIHR